MKSITSFKRTIQVGNRFYSYYDSHDQYKNAVKQRKQLGLKGYNAVIRKLSARWKKTVYLVFTCRKRRK